MSTSKYFSLVLAVAVFLCSGAATFAQTAVVRGVVKVHKADGTEVPVPDAVVEPFRTDIDKGSLPTAKTNKRGEFSFVGFQLGQTYALAVSGTGIAAVVQPNIKGGREDVLIVTNEGDGHRPTEAEVRDFVANNSKAVATGQKTPAKTKEQEELEKKNAEITKKNATIAAGDATARKATTEGAEALNAKNYDLAISKFDEGITAVPDFVGSTPIMLDGKLVALRARGYEKYREGATQTDITARKAKFDEANQDFDDGLKAYDQAMQIYNAAAAPATPQEGAGRDKAKLKLMEDAIEVHRLKAVGGVDMTKYDQAAVVINAYAAIEPDAAKKQQALATLGDIYRNSGQFDKAITTYKSVLETAPDNLEVMASLGLSLVAQGTSVDPPNKEQLQEGLNYMQKYADTVQILPTDSKGTQEFKQSVKDTVQYLTTEQKLKAQPAKSPAKKGKG
ncbi:MAG TPA: tetratricopeptide repeat protein [Pyrinomonadaceae bacterium]